MLTWPSKDPSEDVDYALDWTDSLVSPDVIDTSTWSVTKGDGVLVLANQAISVDNKSTSLWLSAGTKGEYYELTNHVVTVNEREFEQTVCVRIKER